MQQPTDYLLLQATAGQRVQQNRSSGHSDPHPPAGNRDGFGGRICNIAWSDIAMPHFVNTQRSMFSVVA